MTRELIEAVFNTKIDGEAPSIQKAYSDMNGDELEWYVVHFNFLEYPLDYVTHMCKEWALKQGYRILTEPYNDYGHTDWMVEVTKYEKSNPQRFSLYESEHDAVDTACEWILEQKEVEL